MKNYRWNTISMLWFPRGMVVCFLVVYGVLFNRHCHQPWFYLTSRIFVTCLVPFSFLLCGYQIKKRTPIEVLKRSVRKYLLPYLLTAIVTLLFLYIRMSRWEGDSTREFPKTMFGYLFGTSHRTLVGSEEAYGILELWFLLALFFGLFFCALAVYLPVWLQYVSAVFLVAAGYVMSQYGMDVYCIAQGMMGCGYLLAGYRVRESRLLQGGIPLWQLLLGGILGFIMIFIGRIDMEYAMFRYPVIGFVGALLFGIFLFYSCLSVCHRFRKVWVVRAIQAVGFYSFPILLLFHVGNRCIPYAKLLRRMGVPDMAMDVAEIVCMTLYLLLGCIVIKKFRKLCMKRK